jgi:hypothetical protein
LAAECQPDTLLSVSSKYPLESYSHEELQAEFKKLTGYEMAYMLKAAVADDVLDTARLAVHVAVECANKFGGLSGQQLTPSKDMEKEKDKPLKKRVSG